MTLAVIQLYIDQAFIQAVLLMSVFEQRLSFLMFYFMTNNHKPIVKCRCRSGAAVSSAVGSWQSLRKGPRHKGS